MEEGVELPQSSRRTSRRINASTAKLTAASSTSTIPSVKRKQPPAVVKLGAKKAKQTKQTVQRNIGYRCAQHMVPGIIKHLDHRQKGWISEMGLGTANEMSECRIPKGMTLWLIKQVDCPTKSLVINAIPYKIKDYINQILGFCNGNIPVAVRHRGMSKSKPFIGKKDFRSEEAGRGIKLEKAVEELVKMQDKEEFCIMFIMVFLCVFLAPTSGHIINRCYMDMFKHSEHIQQMNWPEFAVDYLIEGIEEFKKSDVTNVNIHGCVALLPLMYMYIAKSPAIQVPHGSAAICSITTDLLHQLEQIDVMPGSSSQNPKYGRILGHVNVDDDILCDDGTSEPMSVSHDPVNVDDDISCDDGTPKHVPVSHDPVNASKLDCPESSFMYSGQTVHSENQKNLLMKIKTLEDGYNMRRENVIEYYQNCLKAKLAELDEKKMADISLLLAQHVPTQPSSVPSLSQIDNNDPPNPSPTHSTPPVGAEMDNKIVLSQAVDKNAVSDTAQEIGQDKCQSSKEAAAVHISPQTNSGTDFPDIGQEYGAPSVPFKDEQAAAILTSFILNVSFTRSPPHAEGPVLREHSSPFMQDY